MKSLKKKVYIFHDFLRNQTTSKLETKHASSTVFFSAYCEQQQDPEFWWIFQHI